MVFLPIALVKAFFTAFDILLIIIGAIFFLEILREAKIIENLVIFLESISPDIRVKVIILAWFLENFIEGVAGFGTPCAIVAPILIGLGFSPLKAVIISLLGNSASVVFGAVGTPIRVGFAEAFTPQIPYYAALFNIIGFLVPVFILYEVVRKDKERNKRFLEGIPFAVWSGLAFTFSSLVFVFLGQEFPSVGGSILGLALAIFGLKLGIFPKQEKGEKRSADMPLSKVLFPYVLFVFLLILGKLIPGQLTIKIAPDLTQKISLFNPGWAFIISGLAVLVISVKSKKIFLDSVLLSIKRVKEPFLVILLMSAMVQLLTLSANSFSLFPSMLESITFLFQNKLLPLWSPLLGAFGSFVTGSATVSNIMFGKMISDASQFLNFNQAKILALEVVGAAAGNMVALADVVAAEVVVGLKNKEREVIRGVILPCTIYVLLTGLIGMIIMEV